MNAPPGFEDFNEEKCILSNLYKEIYIKRRGVVDKYERRCNIKEESYYIITQRDITQRFNSLNKDPREPMDILTSRRTFKRQKVRTYLVRYKPGICFSTTNFDLVYKLNSVNSDGSFNVLWKDGTLTKKQILILYPIESLYLF